jgi:hypothetical protein
MTIGTGEDWHLAAKATNPNDLWVDSSLQHSDEAVQVPGGVTKRVFTHRVIPSWDPSSPSVDQIVELRWIPCDEKRWHAESSFIALRFPETSLLAVLKGIECDQPT